MVKLKLEIVEDQKDSVIFRLYASADGPQDVELLAGAEVLALLKKYFKTRGTILNEGNQFTGELQA